MNVKEQAKTDLVSALKEKDSVAATTLRTLLAALADREREAGGLSEEDALSVLERQVKTRRESVEAFVKGGRPELADKENQELAVLLPYLPEQLSEEEIQALVKEAVESTGAKEVKDMGRVMAELGPKIKGKADGGKVSSLVKDLLL